RIELLRAGDGGEDVRLPVLDLRARTEPGPGADEVARQLDLDARLLERFAADARDELLVDLDPAARRAPDPGRVGRLPDQRQPVAVPDEDRHVVAPPRAGDANERQLVRRHLAVPGERRGLA